METVNGFEMPAVERNRPEHAGRAASAKVFAGEFSRFAVQAIHTRFAAVQWFVTDAERPDERGLATVIRQAPDFAAAILSLPVEAAR